MKFRFLKPANIEFAAAVDYYDQIDYGLGLRFVQETKKSVELIVHHPDAWPVCYHDYRKCHMNVFPFNIIYCLRNDEIIIIAVAHAKRKPDYWSERIS